MNALLEDFYQSTLKLLSPLTEEDTYKTIIEEGNKLVEAEEGSLFLVDEHEKLRRAYSSVTKDRQIEPRKNGYVHTAFITRTPRILTAEEMKAVHPDFDETGIERIYLIPLSFSNESIGVMALRSQKKTRITTRKLKTLQLFGSLASLKVRNLELYIEMKKNVEAKENLLAMASHELKTPLTTVFGYSQLIEKSVQENKMPKGEWIAEVRIQLKRLTGLIDELLNVKALNKGEIPYNWETCHLAELVESAMKEVAVFHPQHKVIFANDIQKGKDNLLGDKKKLIQVFTNILGNAAKFSSPTSSIEVTLKATLADYIITFRDQGEGMNQNDLQYIFSEFHKGTDHTHAGFGLGLYLSKKIIEEHRGLISIASKKNQGTVVEIHLPQLKT